MKKLPVYLSLALTLAGLASCDKELDEAAAPATAKSEALTQQTPQQSLTSGQWRLTELTTSSKAAGAAQATSVNMFDRLKPTLRDNLTQFTTGGQYILDEGATKADAQAAQQKNGTYTLSDDAKTLTVKVGDLERQYSVEELSANTLRLKLTSGEGDGAVSYTSTFSH